jgi:adenylate cyclase
MTLDVAAARGGTYSRPGPESDRIEAGFAAEEAAGQLLALRGRTTALIAIALFLVLFAPFPDVVFYELFIFVFVVVGFARHGLEQTGLFRWWQGYLQISVEFGLLAFILVVPNPLASADPPPVQVALRLGNFVYFYVLLIGLAFSCRPKLVAWGGISGAIAWSIAVAWICLQPDTMLTLPMDLTVNSELLRFSTPTFVDLDMPIRDVVVFLIVSMLLATVVARSRDLVRRQASLERERGNLARYFPPTTVDRLARQDAPLAQAREQYIAVLFADLVGFTNWAERHTSREVIELLREVHGRLEGEVFRHHGTLDKFIGDGLMATFGTPDTGSRDVINAITCLKSIVTDFDVWNERRKTRNEAPIQIAVGLHYGPAVVGNIGTERRLEFAVLGDTVNVANRLESLTRQLQVVAAISGPAAAAARDEAPEDADHVLTGFTYRGPITLRGRDHQVEVLTFGERPTARSS